MRSLRNNGSYSIIPIRFKLRFLDITLKSRCLPITPSISTFRGKESSFEKICKKMVFGWYFSKYQNFEMFSKMPISAKIWTLWGKECFSEIIFKNFFLIFRKYPKIWNMRKRTFFEITFVFCPYFWKFIFRREEWFLRSFSKIGFCLYLRKYQHCEEKNVFWDHCKKFLLFCPYFRVNQHFEKMTLFWDHFCFCLYFQKHQHFKEKDVIFEKVVFCQYLRI